MKFHERISKIMKIIDFDWRITEVMEVLELHLRITKMLKIFELHMRIPKLKKNLKIICEHTEIIKKPRIPQDNLEKKMKFIKLQTRIMKIMRIL